MSDATIITAIKGHIIIPVYGGFDDAWCIPCSWDTTDPGSLNGLDVAADKAYRSCGTIQQEGRSGHWITIRIEYIHIDVGVGRDGRYGGQRLPVKPIVYQLCPGTTDVKVDAIIDRTVEIAADITERESGGRRNDQPCTVGGIGHHLLCSFSPDATRCHHRDKA